VNLQKLTRGPGQPGDPQPLMPDDGKVFVGEVFGCGFRFGNQGVCKMCATGGTRKKKKKNIRLTASAQHLHTGMWGGGFGSVLSTSKVLGLG